MAITENNFTAAEITAAVTANPALLTELKGGLTPLGHHAIAKEEHAGFVEQERTRISAEKTAEIYGKLDDDFLSVSGIPKQTPQEKTYEYAKRVLTTLKEKPTALQAKITELEGKVAAGGDQATKDLLAAAQAQLNDYKTVKEPQWQKDSFAKDVSMDVELGLREIKLKAGLPESIVKSHIANIKAQLINSAAVDANGRIYYKDANGQAILDGVNLAGAKFVLNTLLTDIIDTGKQQEGAGGKTPAGAATKTDVKNADGKDIEVPAGLGSQEELTAFLMGQGLKSSDPGFVKLFSEHNKGADGKALPLRKKV